MIRRRRNPDNGINTYYNIDGKEAIFGGNLDIQKALAPLGELHLHTFPTMKKYQYCGPGTNLEKILKRDDPGINHSDKICKKHDIDYDTWKNLKDKHVVDHKMIDAINQFNDKAIIERGVKSIILMKKKLGLGVKSKNVKGRRGNKK